MLDGVSFAGADFFHTPLAGLDFSRCILERITVSDTLQELKGMRIDASQAPGLIRLLGVQVD